jgi:hypothetical protein
MNPNQKQNAEDLTLSYDAPLEMAPEGRHALLCVDAFETWPEEETWNGETSTKRKLIFVFQVFPEDGSRDSEGDVFRIEHKVNTSLTPASGGFNASGLWTLLENWKGQPLPRKSFDFKLTDMIGKAAWGSLEHKTRYVKLASIEPYTDDNGKPLPLPKAEPYKRRKYPHPDTWKNKKEQSQAQANSNPYDPIPDSKPAPVNADALPF